MRLKSLTPVILESPYAGEVNIIPAHREYLQLCIRWCLNKGFAPFASHQMYTEALDDKKPDERRLGIAAGYAWWEAAEKVLFFTDLGHSKGMMQAVNRCMSENKPFDAISLRDDSNVNAELDRIISRLPGNTQQSPRVPSRDKGQLRDAGSRVQPEDATLRSASRFTA